MSKKYTTNFLEDTNGSTGSANQVLVSTPAGIDWVDGSGSGIIGGPYLPLSAGSSYPLTGDLYIEGADKALRINNGTQPVVYLGDGGANTDGQLILYSSSGVVNVVFNGDNQNHYIANGNVGIGTTSPSRDGLNVFHASSPYVHLTNTTTGDGGSDGGYLSMVGNEFRLGNQETGGALSLFTNNTTGNGIYIPSSGNVGIGTTSPAQKFVVSNSTNGQGLEIIPGTISTIQSYNRAASVYLPLNMDVLDFRFRVNNASEAMRITSGGNVGIGVTNPHTKLTIEDSNIAGTSQFGIGDVSSYYLAMGHNSAGNTDGFIGTVYDNNAARFDIRMKGTAQSDAKVTVLGSGNVGIGTDSPSNPLHVYSSDNILATFESTDGISEIRIKDNTKYTRLLTVGSHFKIMPNDGVEMAVFEGDTGRTLFNGGNVGIGTTSPAFLLHVQGTPPATNGGLINARNSAATATNTTFGGIFFNSSPGNDFSIGKSNVNTATTLSFRNGNDGASLMDITPSGNVGIGTDNPGKKLDVNGEARVNSILTLNRASTASLKFSRGSDFYLGINDSGNLNFLDDSASSLGVWRNNGNFGIGTTSPGEKLEVHGKAFINGQIYGGFGALTTSGTLDWDDSTNARSGNGHTLLRGNATNGPAGAEYYHPFSWEYASYDNDGNMTQFAIPYSTNNTGMYYRSRYSGTWTDWAEIVTTTKTLPGGPYLPLAGGTMTGTIIQNGGNIDFSDGRSANFGTGDDLQIYHSGSASYVDQAGTGKLILNTLNTGINIQAGSGETRFTKGGQNSEVKVDDATQTNKIVLKSNGNSYFNGGNVGIGTTSPDTRLEVRTDSGAAVSNSKLRVTAGAQGAYGGTAHFEGAYNDYGNVDQPNIVGKIEMASEVITATNVGGTMKFFTKAAGGTYATAPIERMRITSTGVIGINKNSPSTEYQLDIKRDMTDPDTAGYAIRIDTNMSGTKGAATDVAQGGIFVDTDSTAIGTTSDEHKVIGINNDVRYSGLPDAVYGTQSRVESNSTQTGQCTTIAAAYNVAQTDGGVDHTVGNLHGTYNLVGLQDNSVISNSYGTRNLIQVIANRAQNVGAINGSHTQIDLDSTNNISYGTITGNRVIIDNSQATAAELGNTYLFRGQYNGVTTDTNCWGLYVGGDKHYLSGNVGIGTTSPDYMLDVLSSAIIGSIDTVSSTTNYENKLVIAGKNNYSDGTTWYGDYGQILLSSNNNMTASARQFLITNALDNNKFAIIRSVDANTSPVTNSTGMGVNSGTADFVIDYSGNVGIGTTSPGYRLEVDGGIGDGVKIKAGNAASKDSLLVSTNNDVSKFLVQGDGKVIINSSAGISGRTENFQVFGKQIITNTGTDGPVLYLGYNSSGSNTIQLGRGRTADGLSYMDFNGEVMSAGQFGFRIIRYSGQNASSELKQIGTGAFKVTCSDSADIILNPNSGNVGISNTGPTHKLDVNGNGRFTSTVTATNFILSSDERLKENVKKVCDNRVKADWKTFELKTEKGQKRYGVIAQELEKTNPEFVREDSRGFKSVAYIDLLIAKIAELEARLEKLEK